MILNIKEVRVDIYSNNTNFIEMRLVHEPTGTIVFGSGNTRHRLKKRLMIELHDKIKNRI